MGKPLFKASDGGQIDILREGEESPKVNSGMGLERKCLRNKGSPRGLSERFTHVRLGKIYAALRLNHSYLE